MEENEGTTRTADDLPQPYYGRVYGKDSLSVYGNRDATGHGTYVASVAAGSDVGDHSGAAPAADIAMVHLKEAKPYLRQYYFIPEDATCYAENDIMFGIQFLDELARMRGQALVICMSLGCGLSSHSGNNSLALYLNDLAVAYRRCVVTATGNLAAARKHFQGVFTAEDIEEGLGKKAYRQVEVVVEEDVCGFVMEQWCLSTCTTHMVAIVSPSRESAIRRSGSRRRVVRSMIFLWMERRWKWTGSGSHGRQPTDLLSFYKTGAGHMADPGLQRKRTAGRISYVSAGAGADTWAHLLSGIQTGYDHYESGECQPRSDHCRLQCRGKCSSFGKRAWLYYRPADQTGSGGTGLCGRRSSSRQGQFPGGSPV